MVNKAPPAPAYPFPRTGGLNTAGVVRLVARPAPDSVRPHLAPATLTQRLDHPGGEFTPDAGPGLHPAQEGLGDLPAALARLRPARCASLGIRRRCARSSGFPSLGREGFARIGAPGTVAELALIAAVRTAPGASSSNYLGHPTAGQSQVVVALLHAGHSVTLG